MAFRFKLNTSQQPQYGYNPVSPLAQAFGNFVNAYMSGPSSYEVDKYQNEAALARLKQEEYTRKFGGYDAISSAFAPGPDGAPAAYDPATQRKIYSEAARAGIDPDKAGGWGRIFTTTMGAPQSAQDQSVYAVAPWSNTKSAFDESQATEVKKANISAGATIQAANIHEAGAMNRTTVPVMGPDGKLRLVTAVQARSGEFVPVLDDSKMSVSPIEGQPGRFHYQPNQPGLLAPVPSSEKDRYVTTIDPNSPTGFGYAPVRPGLPAPSPAGATKTGVNYIDPNGRRGISYDGGRTDETGKPLPPGSRIASPATAEGTREQKIAELEKQGIPREEAAAVVDGIKDIKIDQSSGRVYLIDKRDPTNVQELPVKPAQVDPRVQVPPGAPPGASQSRMADTTGVLPSIADTISGTVGQVIPSAASPQVTRNRQDLGIIGELAVDALLKNSRAPVAEQERIRKLIPTAGIFTSATEASTKLAELRDLTVRRIEADQALLNAPVPYSREARREAEERLRKSDLLLREIDRFTSGGMPAAPPTGGPSPQGPVGQQGAAPPPGTLKPGVHTTFANGQVWTLGPDGQPQRVR